MLEDSSTDVISWAELELEYFGEVQMFIYKCKFDVRDGSTWVKLQVRDYQILGETGGLYVISTRLGSGSECFD